MIEFVYISLCVSCTFVIFCNIVLEVRDLNFVGHTIVAQLTSCCVREGSESSLHKQLCPCGKWSSHL